LLPIISFPLLLRSIHFIFFPPCLTHPFRSPHPIVPSPAKVSVILVALPGLPFPSSRFPLSLVRKPQKTHPRLPAIDSFHQRLASLPPFVLLLAHLYGSRELNDSPRPRCFSICNDWNPRSGLLLLCLSLSGVGLDTESTLPPLHC